ncbi:MAG: MarR family winged helix-turn-helix transcriptional regulator [Gulosibacter sp.]|uniref:MarR family winged helix-turn-helix transcriptional regulator n=1 Tax=Gulosibacter sp. TaxID=2817531 RepID=UPI003F92C4D2
MSANLNGSRLAAIISPLRRALLSAARRREGLPDLSEAQIEVVRALPNGTVSSPGELAKTLSMERSTISNLLRVMERDGLIVRRQSAQDRRGVEVLASAQALDIFARFDAASSAILEESATQLSTQEVGALDAAIPALEKLHEILGSNTGLASTGTNTHADSSISKNPSTQNQHS